MLEGAHGRGLRREPDRPSGPGARQQIPRTLPPRALRTSSWVCAAACAPSLVGSFWASSFWASRTEDQNCGFELAAGFALLAGAVGHAANGRFAVRRRAAASAHRDWRRCGGTGTPGAPAGPRRGSWRAGRSEPQAVACGGLGGLQILPPASARLLRYSCPQVFLSSSSIASSALMISVRSALPFEKLSFRLNALFCGR